MKSDLKQWEPDKPAKPSITYIGKRSKSNPMHHVNKRNRTEDHIEEEPPKKQSPRKPIFQQPLEVSLPKIDGRRISDRIANSPSSFISPDTIITSSFRDVIPRPKSSLSSLRSSQSSQLSSPPRMLEIEDLTKCKFCNKDLPDGFYETPPTSLRARYGYCLRHENASTLMTGRQKGYPSSIDFETLRNRIQDLKPTIRKILDSAEESPFLVDLKKRVSRRTAAQPMIRIKLFQDSQPGYYGPRGTELISEMMMKKFGTYIRSRDNLSDGVDFCGGVTGYISSVIVPEVGVRLIMEDMKVNWKEAREVMKESVTYGNVINPSVEIISDDGTDSEDENRSQDGIEGEAWD